MAIYFKRFIKLFWIMSLLAFLVLLLYVYTGLPELIPLKASILNGETIVVERGNFFYYSLAAFIFSNVAWFLLSRTIIRLKSRSSYFTEGRILDFTNWLNLFSLLINLLFIFSLTFLNVLFSEQQHMLNWAINVIYVILGVMVLWFLVLPYFIVRKESTSGVPAI